MMAPMSAEELVVHSRDEFSVSEPRESAVPQTGWNFGNGEPINTRRNSWSLGEERSRPICYDRHGVGCAKTARLITIGIVMGILIVGLVCFFVGVFVIPTTAWDTSTCHHGWIGIDTVCVYAVRLNTIAKDVIGLCAAVDAEPITVANAKTLLAAIGEYANNTSIGESLPPIWTNLNGLHCLRIDAAGAKDDICSQTATTVCQKPRPLGSVAGMFRYVRRVFGLS